MNFENLNKIYKALGDEHSRLIFENRIMYSISWGDFKYIRNIAFLNRKIKKFKDELENIIMRNEIVIFGAGETAKRIYRILPDFPWKYFIDSNISDEENRTIDKIPIISYEHFIKNYHGEYIVISSEIYGEEMIKQLNTDGIDKNIIDFGKIRGSLRYDQYFDLEYLRPALGKEFFVDVGCHDAMTSINFKKWCKGTSFVYAFEPDFRKIEKCKYNFEKNNIDYELFNEGIWKEDAILKFSIDTVMGYVSETGEQNVKVTSLDRVLNDKEVTFIKMDIEGSEVLALLGAEKLIKKNRPKLAICVYHTFEDIFRVPEIILGYYPNYKLYLRHYSIHGAETVLYALPE